MVLDAEDLRGWAYSDTEVGEEHLLVGIPSEKAEAGLSNEDFKAGSVLGKHKFYEKIGAESYVINVVKEGYRLLFDQPPPPSYTRNNKSALQYPEFVREEIRKLENMKCVERTEVRPTIVLPLSLVYSNKWRLCLDCSRGLNPYCTDRPVSLDGLGRIADTVRKDSFMVVNDLQSGYYQVPVHKTDQQLLGFQYQDEAGKEIFYIWKVLVLGVKDAVHVFKRLTAPLMAHLRKQGYTGQIYIDDVLTAGDTKENALWMEKKLYQVFKEGGWSFKLSKRSGEPSKKCRYLGLIIDSEDMTLNIPSEKIEELEQKCTNILKLNKAGVKVKEVAKVVGKLQSLRLATGPIVSVLTRSLYATIASAKSWGSWVKLDELATYELNWWKENLRHTSKFPISVSLSAWQAHFKVASDASDIGYYCYLTGRVPKVLAARGFTEEEQSESSTWRELKAFHDTWTNESNLKMFRNRKVVHYGDNKAMMYIVERGSRNRRLQPLIVEATVALRKYNISMEAVWVSREDGIITLADEGSRDYDRDDISLDFDTMSLIFQIFGDFDLDAMATASTTKGRNFFSKRQTPGTSGVNFFHQDLRQYESIFCFPPPRLARAAMQQMKDQEVRAIFVIPVWPASTFFSSFFPDGVHALKSVQKMLFIDPRFICGEQVTSHIMRGKEPYQTVVLELDFRRSAPVKPARVRCLKKGCNICV